MKRLGFLAIAALAAACGGDGDHGKGTPPETPVFAGLDSVALVPGEVDQVELRWTRGTDDKTAADRIRYELWVRPNRDATPDVYDVSAVTDGVYRWASLPRIGDVYWFSVVASDEDGNETGDDRRLPAVSPSDPPRIVSVSPARLAAGEWVTIVGEYLLDEPMLPDAVTIGGQPVDAADVAWSSRVIEFRVPRTFAGEARVAVTTPFGRAEAPETLVIDPPGPVGHD
jgi:hypothetical protein